MAAERKLQPHAVRRKVTVKTRTQVNRTQQSRLEGGPRMRIGKFHEVAVGVGGVERRMRCGGAAFFFQAAMNRAAARRGRELRT